MTPETIEAFMKIVEAFDASGDLVKELIEGPTPDYEAMRELAQAPHASKLVNKLLAIFTTLYGLSGVAKGLLPENTRPPMTEEEVRIQLSILHDMFPVKTMRVVTHLTERDVEEFSKALDRMTPILKKMLNDRIGDPIPYD